MKHPYRSIALLGVFAFVAVAWPENARAAPDGAAQVMSDRVVVPGDSGVLDLPVHPAVMTVLYFPDPVRRYVRSDEKNFIVGATGASVAVRPLPDTPAGTYASVNIVTETMRISVRVRVVEAAEDAYLQVSFVPYVVEVTPTVPIKDRLSVHVAGALGRAWTGDTSSGTESAYLATLRARLSLRGSRFHAYDVLLMVGQTTSTRFDESPFAQGSGERMAGDYQHGSVLARVAAGAGVDLGTRITPVLRIRGGVQARTRQGSRHVVGDSVFDLADNRTEFDLTGSAEVGVLWRLGQKWSLGLGVTMTRAIPLYGGSTYESIEGAIYAGWY